MARRAPPLVLAAFDQLAGLGHAAAGSGVAAVDVRAQERGELRGQRDVDVGAAQLHVVVARRVAHDAHRVWAVAERQRARDGRAILGHVEAGACLTADDLGFYASARSGAHADVTVLRVGCVDERVVGARGGTRVELRFLDRGGRGERGAGGLVLARASRAAGAAACGKPQQGAESRRRDGGEERGGAPCLCG